MSPAAQTPDEAVGVAAVTAKTSPPPSESPSLHPSGSQQDGGESEAAPAALAAEAALAAAAPPATAQAPPPKALTAVTAAGATSAAPRKSPLAALVQALFELNPLAAAARRTTFPWDADCVGPLLDSRARVVSLDELPHVVALLLPRGADSSAKETAAVLALLASVAGPYIPDRLGVVYVAPAAPAQPSETGANTLAYSTDGSDTVASAGRLADAAPSISPATPAAATIALVKAHPWLHRLAPPMPPSRLARLRRAAGITAFDGFPVAGHPTVVVIDQLRRRVVTTVAGKALVGLPRSLAEAEVAAWVDRGRSVVPVWRYVGWKIASFLETWVYTTAVVAARSVFSLLRLDNTTWPRFITGTSRQNNDVASGVVDRSNVAAAADTAANTIAATTTTTITTATATAAPTAEENTLKASKTTTTTSSTVSISTASGVETSSTNVVQATNPLLVYKPLQTGDVPEQMPFDIPGDFTPVAPSLTTASFGADKDDAEEDSAAALRRTAAVAAEVDTPFAWANTAGDSSLPDRVALLLLPEGRGSAGVGVRSLSTLPPLPAPFSDLTPPFPLESSGIGGEGVAFGAVSGSDEADAVDGGDQAAERITIASSLRATDGGTQRIPSAPSSRRSSMSSGGGGGGGGGSLSDSASLSDNGDETRIDESMVVVGRKDARLTESVLLIAGRHQ